MIDNIHPYAEYISILLYIFLFQPERSRPVDVRPRLPLRLRGERRPVVLHHPRHPRTIARPWDGLDGGKEEVGGWGHGSGGICSLCCGFVSLHVSCCPVPVGLRRKVIIVFHVFQMKKTNYNEPMVLVKKTKKNLAVLFRPNLFIQEFLYFFLTN